MVSIGVVGAGQFAGQFAALFKAHPNVERVVITDLLIERAEELSAREGLDGVVESFDALLQSDVDAIALFTQRWTHGPLVVAALEAGKHVYSAVPMAISVEEISAIIEAVRATGLTYMMGETSYYNPATVFARQKVAEGAFGRIFYAEGDYVHDMDLGFYAAYEYSGGEQWRRTASYPPMLYSTHSVGGVLGAIPGHAVSVSCLGYHDERNDGVFDRDISDFDNDISNASALFELDNGTAVRINEMRRVGYPSPLRESRFRYFGTEASFEQLATVSVWQNRDGVQDVSHELEAAPSLEHSDPSLAHVDPELRQAFVAGYAPIHDASRIPEKLRQLPNGHEGSHHFLVDDFVQAVTTNTPPPVNAWVAARYTLPGIVAHQSALQGGERLPIPDFGDAPQDALTSVGEAPSSTPAGR